jgi:hypothetical protein
MSNDEGLEPRDWGVAWFDVTPYGGVCQRCQKAKPVYKGYNGGQPMGIDMCGKCCDLAVRESHLYSEQSRKARSVDKSRFIEDSIEFDRIEKRRRNKLEIAVFYEFVEKFPVGSTVSWTDNKTGVIHCGVVAKHTGLSSRADICLKDGQIVLIRYRDLFKGDLRPQIPYISLPSRSWLSKWLRRLGRSIRG